MLDKCCRKCGETKPLSAFNKDKNRKDGYSNCCKDCRQSYRVLWDNSAVSQRASLLKIRYGLSVQDYNRMFQKQKGYCAICGLHQVELSRRLAVDHNHKTKKVRGLLCHNCNHGLGNFKDSRGHLVKAIQYLGLKGTGK